jgi:hypothetical protein
MKKKSKEERPGYELLFCCRVRVTTGLDTRIHCGRKLTKRRKRGIFLSLFL